VTDRPTALDWDLVESGPADAARRVLLLPGGMLPARAYADVMADPAFSDVRMVAASLPGHCGTPPPPDPSIETTARLAADLATHVGANVLVGSSMGATVALEMIASRAFVGPTVLLEISLSPQDDAAFMRAVVRLSSVLGTLPIRTVLRMIPMMMKGAAISPDRKAELTSAFKRNDPRQIRLLMREYLRHLGRYPQPARRLCDAGVPTWVMHSEHGDGGLTADERRVLATCGNATVITLPGTTAILAVERPRDIAKVIGAALAAV
jgi:pimeloyl-ACP methyl ester carboxylesterase